MIKSVEGVNAEFISEAVCIVLLHVQLHFLVCAHL